MGCPVKEIEEKAISSCDAGHPKENRQAEKCRECLGISMKSSLAGTQALSKAEMGSKTRG